MRKTYTSPEVKNRWNRKHYDQVQLVIPAGGRDELKHLAEESGESVSAYIRRLVMRDARERGEELTAIGGGGSLSAG